MGGWWIGRGEGLVLDLDFADSNAIFPSLSSFPVSRELFNEKMKSEMCLL